MDDLDFACHMVENNLTTTVFASSLAKEQLKIVTYDKPTQ